MRPHPQGEGHHAAKLTADQVRDIRVMYDRGDLPSAIAKKFGTDTSQIAKIGQRKTWRGVEPIKEGPLGKWGVPSFERHELHQFDGMRIGEAAALLGIDVPTARKWVNGQGLRCQDNVIRRPRDPREIDDEIRARLAAAPPSAPCFRCGARGACEHRQ